MNLQNYFHTTWKSSFPDDADLDIPSLTCLQAEHFSGLSEQREALENEIESLRVNVDNLQAQLRRKLFLQDYLTKCILKLNEIAKMFDSGMEKIMINNNNNNIHNNNGSNSSSSNNVNKSGGIQSSQSTCPSPASTLQSIVQINKNNFISSTPTISTVIMPPTTGTIISNGISKNHSEIASDSRQQSAGTLGPSPSSSSLFPSSGPSLIDNVANNLLPPPPPPPPPPHHHHQATLGFVNNIDNQMLRSRLPSINTFGQINRLPGVLDVREFGASSGDLSGSLQSPHHSVVFAASTSSSSSSSSSTTITNSTVKRENSDDIIYGNSKLANVMVPGLNLTSFNSDENFKSLSSVNNEMIPNLIVATPTPPPPQPTSSSVNCPSTTTTTTPAAAASSSLSLISSSQSSVVGGGNHLCEICGKGFATSASLSQHRATHSTERPFQCDQCGRTFRHKAQLVTHERIHTGQRPYGCSLCGKRFRQQSHVIQHLKVHTGERPFVCDRCGKAFRQKTALEKHVARQCKSRRSNTRLQDGQTLWYGLPTATSSNAREYQRVVSDALSSSQPHPSQVSPLPTSVSGESKRLVVVSRRARGRGNNNNKQNSSLHDDQETAMDAITISGSMNDEEDDEDEEDLGVDNNSEEEEEEDDVVIASDNNTYSFGSHHS